VSAPFSAVDVAVDRFLEARKAIFEHVGYRENWRVFPIDDNRELFWAVDEQEREWVRFSPERAALAYWLEDHDDEYGPYGNILYQDVIYTQRHFPKWVYRGADLTLVVADTQTDDNKFLRLFRNANEVRPRVIDDHPVNLVIDRLITDDMASSKPSSSEVLLGKIRARIEEVPLGELREAILKHRTACFQSDCWILAAMEESAAAREGSP
jgi:hypothetical protein